jgi:hypothetical protein
MNLKPSKEEQYFYEPLARPRTWMDDVRTENGEVYNLLATGAN